MSCWLPICGAVIHSRLGCLDGVFAILPTQWDREVQLLTGHTPRECVRWMRPLTQHLTHYLWIAYYVLGARGE